MVGRCDNDGSTRVALFDFPRSIADARRSATHTGLEKHVVGWDIGQLFAHDVGIVLGSDHPNVGGWHDALKAIYSELEHSAPASQDVEKLLGTLYTTHRPKAATNAACHDDKMLM